MENDDAINCLRQELSVLRHRVIELEKSEAKLIKTKRALEQTQANLLAMVENTDDYILFSDERGYPRFFNKAYAAIMKAALGVEMRPGIKPHELLPPEAKQYWNELHRRVLGGEKFVAEYAHEFPDGQLRYFEVSFNPIIEQGKIIGFSEYTHDITQRKLSQLKLQKAHDELENRVAERTRELQEREATLRAIINGTSDLVALIDPAGKLLEVNISGARRFGCIREEILGKCGYDFLPPEVRNHRKLLVEQVVRTGKAVRDVDQRGEFWFDISYNPLFDASGAVKQIVVFARDITAEKRIQEALFQEKNRAQLYLDIAGAIIVALDTAGKVNLINQKGCDLLGYSREEIIGRDWFAYSLPSEEQTEVREVFAMLMTGKFTQQEYYENYVVTRSGERRLISWHNTLLHDDAGNITGTLSSGEDITERKRYEQELQRNQKLESLGIFAGGIAHDFNNILTVILGNIDLVKSGLDPSSENHEILSDSITASLQAKALTNQLLTFAKGGVPIKKTLPFEKILEEAANFVLHGTGTRCDLRWQDDLYPVDIDEGQMSQVIHNLIINASQAMPDGGTIKVRAYNIVLAKANAVSLPPGNYLQISISDSGQGIKPEHLNKIFDPYFTTKPRGSGLGLATAYTIVKKHGGCLTVESQWQVGTTIHLFLPASTKSITRSLEKISGKQKLRLKVLVMDDEKPLRDLAKRMLEKLGCRCWFAEEGNRALQLYQEALEANQPFDVVIMDLTVIGGKGGKETITELLRIAPEAKAIVASGYSDDQVIANYRQYGFVGYLTKPFVVNDLHRALSSATGNMETMES